MNQYRLHFYVNWYPNPLFTAEQARRRRFLINVMPFFSSDRFSQHMTMYLDT